tara:strand:- start:4065 stop:4553 length:489 start_codon:yes stop_codon:yes gene_type:complete
MCVGVWTVVWSLECGGVSASGDDAFGFFGLRRSFETFFFALFGFVFGFATLIRSGIFDDTVGCETFVTFWEIFGDRHTFFVYEEQAVTIFVDFHVFTGADPGAVFDLFLFVGVEATRAQWATDLIDVGCEAFHDALGDTIYRVKGCTCFLCVFLGKLPHLLE